ncbi:MAG: hypothetical protein ABUL72_01645 [Armatimonadota bacterium]
MKRFFLAVALLAVGVMVNADSFTDIMATHRKAVASLSLSAATRQKVADLDDDFEKSMRADLDQLVTLERSSPKRAQLLAKMKKDNAVYRQSLEQALGSNWVKYQRAYGRLAPSTKSNTSKPSQPSKSKKKASTSASHKKGK